MLTLTEFAKRRKRLAQKIGSTGIVILPSAPLLHRNGDAEHAYRQDSDFYYLTGFEEPDAVAILAPKRQEGEFILFNRPRNRSEEIWNGYRAGQTGACKDYLANQSFPIEELPLKLPELLSHRTHLYYTLGLNKFFDALLMKAIQHIRARIRNGVQPPISFVDLTDTLHEMRLIKSPAEIKIMKKAAAISAKAHTKAMQACRVGMHEYQLEAELRYEFIKNGARELAYNSIIGSGANSCILHYVDNKSLIRKGDLVLIDAGCEYQNYASDITRTFPANGLFSKEQRAIYDLVLKAQLAAIQTIRPGRLFNEAQEVIVKILTEGLKNLGLLKGGLQDLIKKEAYFKFYMHKSGHWLGLDVHDVGRYKVKDKWRKLQPGMVLTVEPGIYIPADLKDVPKKWHNIGIRIEDDILVTSKGHEVLSANAPKTPSEIESLMRK